MAHIRFSSTASVGTWSIDFKYDEWPESSVRDRVCMTAALLVLEPIFAAADLPSEIYAYRAGRNA